MFINFDFRSSDLFVRLAICISEVWIVGLSNNCGSDFFPLVLLYFGFGVSPVPATLLCFSSIKVDLCEFVVTTLVMPLLYCSDFALLRSLELCDADAMNEW